MNQFLNIYKEVIGETPGILISSIKVNKSINIWETICNTYLNTPEYFDKRHKDPYGAIYHLNIKSYIKKLFPDLYENIKLITLKSYRINIDGDYILICLGTSNDYRKFDEKFDNELSFLEYINSEISEIDKHRNITDEILKEAGFEYLETESNLGREAYKLNSELGSKYYKVYRKWTEDKPFPIKIDIDNGPNNSGTPWHLHIDNNSCETIGCADINTIWQFNTLMQVFKSKFRL